MRTEHEVIRLRRAVSGIPAGGIGTIMMISPEDPSEYLIEFPDPEGKSILLVQVHESDLESTAENPR